MTGPALGIGVAMLATIAYQLGLVAEKRALARLPAIQPRQALAAARTLLTAPTWLAGFAVMLCGLALQVTALALAPVSVVQPVQAAGIVILLIASRIVLRERLQAAEVAGMVIIAAAVAAIAVSTAGPAGQHVGHHAAAAAVAVVGTCSVLAAVLLGSGLLRSGGATGPLPGGPVPYGISAGLFYGVAALAAKGLSAAVLGHPHLGLPLARAIAGSPYLYLLAASSGAGLLIFQAGLQRCPVSVIGPVSNLAGSVFFLIAGTWLFGERLPGQHALLELRLSGIVAAGLVIVLLARRTAVAPGAAGPRPAAVEPARPKGAHRRPRASRGGAALAAAPRQTGSRREPPAAGAAVPITARWRHSVASQHLPGAAEDGMA
jgi:drug/metabolite transporter (DMT)-like permease